MSELILIRHGETAWSRTGQHAGRTDLPLTKAGEDAACALAPRLAGREFVAVYTSPLTRAVRTAELAGLSGAEADADLIEWNYGRYEGLTAEQIQELKPGWELWRDGVDAGEDLGHVTVRVDAFLRRVRPLLDKGDVASSRTGISHASSPRAGSASTRRPRDSSGTRIRARSTRWATSTGCPSCSDGTCRSDNCPHPARGLAVGRRPVRVNGNGPPAGVLGRSVPRTRWRPGGCGRRSWRTSC